MIKLTEDPTSLNVLSHFRNGVTENFGLINAAI
jgi:hypothetical protein